MTDSYGNTVPDRVVVSKSACRLAAKMPLPSAGRVITFVDQTGLASTVASIVLSPNGSETINGGSSYTMSTNYGSVTVRSYDGVNWIASAGG